MKDIIRLITVVAALFLATATSMIAATNSDSTKANTNPLKNQTLCPVMKKPIDSSAYTDIQGQRVYHCCSGCEKALRKNPDKYFEEAAAEGVVFQNIQKVCPVSGMPIDKKFETYYKGRHLYFGSADCVTKFNKSPLTYLPKIDEKVKAEAKGSADHSSNGH